MSHRKLGLPVVIQVEVILFSQRFYFGIGWFSNRRKKNYWKYPPRSCPLRCRLLGTETDLLGMQSRIAFQIQFVLQYLLNLLDGCCELNFHFFIILLGKISVSIFMLKKSISTYLLLIDDPRTWTLPRQKVPWELLGQTYGPFFVSFSWIHSSRTNKQQQGKEADSQLLAASSMNLTSCLHAPDLYMRCWQV